MRTSVPRWTSDTHPNQASDIVAVFLDARVSERLLVKGSRGDAILLRTEITQRRDGSSVIAVLAAGTLTSLNIDIQTPT